MNYCMKNWNPSDSNLTIAVPHIGGETVIKSHDGLIDIIEAEQEIDTDQKITRNNLTINDLLMGLIQGISPLTPVKVVYRNDSNEGLKAIDDYFYKIEDIPEEYKNIPIVRLEGCGVPEPGNGPRDYGICIHLKKH